MRGTVDGTWLVSAGGTALAVCVLAIPPAVGVLWGGARYRGVVGTELKQLAERTVVYDNRGFGASGGEPRQELDPWAQVGDYRHACTFAETLDLVDNDRIGFWGVSYGGGNAIVAAALDRRCKCVVSVVPMISGYRQFRRFLPAHLAPMIRAAFGPMRSLTLADYGVGLSNKLMGQVNLVRVGIDFVSDGGSFTLSSGILSRQPMEGGAALSLVNAGLEGFVRGAAIELPADAGRIDFEGEIGVVIGTRLRKASAAECAAGVRGVVAANDVSARDWQLRKPGGQWLLGKSFDTFAPFGPAIVTASPMERNHAFGANHSHGWKSSVIAYFCSTSSLPFRASGSMPQSFFPLPFTQDRCVVVVPIQ